MAQKLPLVLSWSGGKDSALALFHLQKQQEFEVVALLTSVAAEFDRISHHGVRRELLEQQADAIGIPLDIVFLPAPCTNDVYEQLMREVTLRYASRGVAHVGFGDIFLEDLRAYRERNLAEAGMQGVFPLWQQDTTELARTFIDLGFQAVLTCVESVPGEPFAGRKFDPSLLADLPPEVDPCGENGEFHSFVYDGPVFRSPVEVVAGETLARDGRFYTDLLPCGCGDLARASEMPPVGESR